MKSDTLKKEANLNFYNLIIEFYKFCVTVGEKIAKVATQGIEKIPKK